MLNGLVRSNAVEVGVQADSWRDAVRKSGELLLNAGAIEERYIAAMIDKVKQLGPYIVIAPNIAMPHARPEDGVLKTSIAILLLDEAVEFGHETNDPVKLVIALAAADNTEHINSLAALMELLGDKSVLNGILNSKTVGELLGYLALLKGEEIC